MALNIFEGARRIAKLITTLWVVGVAGYLLIENEPYIDATYVVTWPNSPPVRSDPSCEYGDNVQEYLTVKTAKGTDAHLTLCFMAKTADDGSKLVPYKINLDANEWWGDKSYSSKVRAYTERVKSTFVLSKADEEWIDGQWWPKRWDQIRTSVLVLVGGIAFIWGLTWVVGWIMRGFLGISHGQDRKAEKGSEAGSQECGGQDDNNTKAGET